MSSLNPAYTPVLPMAACHCQAVRQAAQRVTALYDAALAPLGIRVTQFGILARLGRDGPRSIQALAADMVMDRTTRPPCCIRRCGAWRRRYSSRQNSRTARNLIPARCALPATRRTPAPGNERDVP